MSVNASIRISSGSIAVFSFLLTLGRAALHSWHFLIICWILQKIGCRDLRFSYLLLRSAKFCCSRRWNEEAFTLGYDGSLGASPLASWQTLLPRVSSLLLRYRPCGFSFRGFSGPLWVGRIQTPSFSFMPLAAASISGRLFSSLLRVAILGISPMCAWFGVSCGFEMSLCIDSRLPPLQLLPFQNIPTLFPATAVASNEVLQPGTLVSRLTGWWLLCQCGGLRHYRAQNRPSRLFVSVLIFPFRPFLMSLCLNPWFYTLRFIYPALYSFGVNFVLCLMLFLPSVILVIIHFIIL